MKQSRPVKKKKKEMTWAEAATEVLERSTSKILGVRQIQEKIFDLKLKDIKMTKQSENVLKTMLTHHANIEDCPFYKVKDKSNHYALKKSHMYLQDADSDSPIDINEDSNTSVNSVKRKSKRKASPLSIVDVKSNDTQLMKKSITNKVIAGGMTRRSNSYTGSALRKAQLLSRRRTSSPNVMSSSAHSNLRSRAQLQSVHRSRSVNCLQRSPNPGSNNKSRNMPMIDLETPGSVLTNTRLKSVVNSATFSMLPAIYQYQLVQLLPDVDRVVDENGVPRMSQNALSNEFFSQALMDWITQLSDGEFTRETQARIMQEIAKERSKVNPWKEKFFEEYYGQKTELKRTRSRSHDATSNLTDLSFEGQLAKFDHLRNAVDEEQTKIKEENDKIISVVSGSDSDEDPDYAESKSNPRTTIKPIVQNPPLKHINRRKINKPFKRTMVNSAGDYSHSTSMIHRKAIPLHSTTSLFSHLGSNIAVKFKPQASLPHHPNFQIRDEFYRSDSEASDTGELSDSNSFHQHDESDCDDDDDESSDGLMNVGDDNLMDVDSDSDQFDPECVTGDHSYTRLPDLNTVRRRSSDDRDWRRRQLQGLASVKPVMSTDDNKIQSSTQNTTLILRPKGNLEQTVQAMNYSEDSSSTSPEQPYKRLTKDQPMFGKILTVSKENTSKEERVGVLFGRNLQPTANTYHGESIIPRISVTSGLLSSPIIPTTVCTSTTPARHSEQHKTNVVSPKLTCHIRSEDATTLKTNKNNNNAMVAGGGVATLPKKPENEIQLKTRTSNVEIVKGGSGQATMPAVSNVEQIQKNAISNMNKTSSINESLKPINDSGKVSNNEDCSPPVTLKQSPVPVTPVEIPSSTPGEVHNEERPSSPVLSAAKNFPPKPSPTKSVTETSKLSPVLAGVQDRKRPASSPATSSPVKRTRTLAEIKAQMKAKRLAAASGSPVKTTVPSQTCASKMPVKIAQPVFCPTSTKSLSTTKIEDKSSQESSEISDISSKTHIPENCPPMFAGAIPETGFSTETESCPPTTEAPVTDVSDKSPILKKCAQSAESSPKNPGKIILKIKAQEGKKYSVKVDTRSSTPDKTSESDEDSKSIIRKSRRLSQVISSSGESGDDLEKSNDLGGSDPRMIDSYAMLSQLSLPGMYTGKVVSVIDTHLLKRTQKSPVFGEPAFESMSSLTKTITPSLSVTANSSESSNTKCQPFISDKPVIGFQDIPSCTALSSSNAPTFVQPCTTISATKDTQKYRSTSKGKSLIQMQELARTNQIPSDDSENVDSDTEDSVVSTTSSAEEDTTYENDHGYENLKHEERETPNKPNLRNRSVIDNERPTDKNIERDFSNLKQGAKQVKNEESDYEDSYSSSSNDDKPIITDCICACKRLVLCKGCGAYTHEECLSSSKLCSLCCV
uniref:uncharacterized protein LOC120345693 n=1 Tax=Styela clava TaxID=7725 RepID=UPI0019392EE9|nr:uncharacterized protein LOC120345693 [Styela clava]